MEVVEAVYENDVLRPLKKLNLPEHTRVRIVITPDIDEIIDSMLIRKVEKINYKRLKEAYYESL
ncbi:antitoxin family protein [Thermococcus gammatolerans]|uniref:Antitoxin n=1 Tax=Thermococcus gammatolerans (strain DSM 15229 / JCM 11827 / EJ3) TaxID=593117 RepID=C5A2H5_THEGJ|nr:antitoxin family protein [Thermococcus gammatolerans]ACS34594.1 Conserved hypothetical protein [Thermococcus gammatolerans EJ3]